MFSNHGDRRMNKRVLEKLGYQEFYADIDKDFLVIPRHYVILNLTPDIPFKLRVLKFFMKILNTLSSIKFFKYSSV